MFYAYHQHLIFLPFQSFAQTTT